MFAKHRSLSTHMLVRTSAVLAITSSASAEAWESVKRSLLELARSRSCQSSAFS